MPRVTGQGPAILLHAARLHHGWSQQAVADQIGTTPNTVSRWELGLSIPGPYFRARLCDLFGISQQVLWGWLGRGKSAPALLPGSDPDVTCSPSTAMGWPLWQVPFRRNPCFTGREGALQRLHEVWQRQEPASLPLVQVICGLAGMGKTQLALEYAYRYRADYRVVLWVRAETGALLHADFASFARLVGLDAQDERNPRCLRAAIKCWFGKQTNWLLILDNVADLAELGDILPPAGAGHLLLTTQNPITGTLTGRTVALDPMEPDEGALLLLCRAKCLPTGGGWQDIPEILREAARAVSEQLDGLPLALDQAGAYLEETGCSLTDYLRYSRERRAFLLKRRGEAETLHPASVSATLSLAIASAAQANPVVSRVLRLCAFVHAEAIPEEFLAEGIGSDDESPQGILSEATALDAAMHDLRRFSLVGRQAETKTLYLHRLVQEVVRDGMDEQEVSQWVEHSLLALGRLFPDMDEVPSWSRYYRFIHHVQACASFIARSRLASAEISDLLYRAGRALHTSGQYAQAEPLLQQALEMRVRMLDPDDLLLAQTLTALGFLYFSLNKYAEAESLLERALAIRERALGPLHLQVAESLNALGLLANFQDDFWRAEAILKQALAIREAAVGPHPRVAESLANLGSLYLDYGQYAQAEALLEQAQVLFEQTVGPEDSSLDINRNTLASLSLKQGRVQRAESLAAGVLARGEARYGSAFPRLAEPLAILGELRALQGAYTEAERLCQRAIALYEQANGPSHPSLASPLVVLANVAVKQGAYVEAEHLCERVLALFAEGLGAEHFFTISARHLLGEIYTLQGAYEQAERLLQSALAIEERITGIELPTRAETLLLLGRIACAQDRHTQAKDLYQQARALLQRTVGPDHPQQAHLLCEQASLHEAQGEAPQARLLYRQARAIWDKTLGAGSLEAINCLEHERALLHGNSESSMARVESEGTTDSLFCQQEQAGESPSTQPEANPLAPFVRERCLLHPRASCASSTLWEAYQGWTRERHDPFSLSRREFSRCLKASGAIPARTNTCRMWRGISLVERLVDEVR